MTKIPFVSVVAPVYNEEESVREFARRMSATLSAYAQRYEILFIDDGSTDNSLSLIAQMHRENPAIKALSFSRNFGHAAAISAGLAYAQGDATVIIDSDLQDPPEVLPDFFKKWREGYQVVYGVRTKRKEWFLKRFAYWLFYRLFSLVAVLDNVAIDSGDFCLLDKEVVFQLRALPERGRFMRGLRSFVGYRQCGVIYERAGRFSGTSKYSFSKLLRLALDGIFSFSYIPLRLATFFGLFVASGAFISILVILYLRVTRGVIGTSGFTSTIIAVLFIGAIQLISVGILGEYVGRIYDEVKQRPIYIVREKIGFAKHPHESH